MYLVEYGFPSILLVLCTCTSDANEIHKGASKSQLPDDVAHYIKTIQPDNKRRLQTT